MCFFFDRGLLSMCFIQLFKAHDSFSSSFLDVRKDPKHLFRKRSKMGDQTNPLLTFRTRKVNKRIGLLRPKASFCNIFAGTPHLTIFGATKYAYLAYLAIFGMFCAPNMVPEKILQNAVQTHWI